MCHVPFVGINALVSKLHALSLTPSLSDSLSLDSLDASRWFGTVSGPLIAGLFPAAFQHRPLLSVTEREGVRERA